MPPLPPECLLQIVPHVDTVEDLCTLLRVNKLLSFTAAQCLWYDPIHTTTQTRQPNLSLIRLVRLIYAISPSKDEKVQKMRQFLEWAAAPDSNPFHAENVRYSLEHRDALREPFDTTTQPLFDYLSFIGNFNVFVHSEFHDLLGAVICFPLAHWLHASRRLAENALEHNSNDDDEDDDDDIAHDNHYASVDLLDQSLPIAAYGHRLPRLKCISMPFRYIDQFLGPAGVSSPSLLKIRNVEKMVWDMAPRRAALWGPAHDYDDVLLDQVFQRIQQCREQLKWFHTVELQEERTVFGFEAPTFIAGEILKHLPPLPSPKSLDNSIMDRVFEQWKDTDLSRVVNFSYTIMDPERPQGDVRTWPGFEATRAGQHQHQTGGGDEMTGQGKALQQLRSLRYLDFEAWDDLVFDWAVKEKHRRDRGEAIQLVSLRAITVYCQLDHVERIANDAVAAFGETLEKLDIRVDAASNLTEEFISLNTTPKLIRIGHGWHLPHLSHFALDVTMEAVLDIDPIFLSTTTNLTHLELADGSLEEDPPEHDEVRIPTLHAPRMRHLRLIGTACWLFDPASLTSMCDSLKHLELRNQYCVFGNEPDHDHWRWQEWSFPQLQKLSLEGSTVAGFPWHKIAEFPQLESVFLGAGPYKAKVTPWLEVPTEREKEIAKDSIKDTAKTSSSVKRLELKGSWFLTAQTLQKLVQDVCPMVKSLSLTRCKGHTCEDLLQVLKNNQHLRCILTNRQLDFITKDLSREYYYTHFDDAIDAEDYKPRIVFAGQGYFLSNDLIA